MNQLFYARKWFIKTALSYLGTPYIWGGDDPSGFDCSGYVIECLKSAGLMHENDDFTAEGLWKLYQTKQVDKPKKGALLFYLSKSRIAFHVVICLDEWFQIGASGGNSKTIDKKNAWEQNAFIKIRPINFNKEKMKVVYLFSRVE